MSKQQQRNSPATSSSSTTTIPSSSPSSMTKQAKPTVVPTTSSSSSSTTTTTTMRMVLMIVSLHILGILFGFCIFYIIFHNECAHRINSIQNEYNTSINTLQNEKLTQRVLQEQIESDIISNHEKINIQYNECIQSQTSIYEKLQTIQQNEMKLQRQIQNITKQNEELQTTIQHNEKQYNNIQNQFNLTKIMMHEKIIEVERYKKQLLHNNHINYDDSTSSSLSTNNRISEYDATPIIRQQQQQQQQEQTSTNDTINIVQIQADIKRRHYAMIQQTFGIEQQQQISSSSTSSPAYHVLFVLQNSINQVITSIVIELDALYDMSHTTFTFLSMIQNQFYINTSFQSIEPNIIKQQHTSSSSSSSSSSRILLGGHPNTCTNTIIESKLKRQYAEYGYNIEHLLYFTERNMKHICKKTSISFSNHGPDIIIYINDPTTTTTTTTTIANTRSQPLLLDTCFGHVISGFDSLIEQLVPITDSEHGKIDNHNKQEQEQQQQRFTIIDARIIMNANNNQDDS